MLDILLEHPGVLAVLERTHTASMVAILPGIASLATVDLTSTTDPLASLVQYGVLGLVVLAFITGWIVPGPQAKQLMEENKRLNTLIETKLLPMSEQYAASQEKTANVMEKCTLALERAITVLEGQDRSREVERIRDSQRDIDRDRQRDRVRDAGRDRDRDSSRDQDFERP